MEKAFKSKGHFKKSIMFWKAFLDGKALWKAFVIFYERLEDSEQKVPTKNFR